MLLFHKFFLMISVQYARILWIVPSIFTSYNKKQIICCFIMGCPCYSEQTVYILSILFITLVIFHILMYLRKDAL